MFGADVENENECDAICELSPLDSFRCVGLPSRYCRSEVQLQSRRCEDETRDGRRGVDSKQVAKQKKKQIETTNTINGAEQDRVKKGKNCTRRQETNLPRPSTAPQSRNPPTHPQHRNIPGDPIHRLDLLSVCSTQSLSRLRMSHNRVGWVWQTPKKSREEVSPAETSRRANQTKRYHFPALGAPMWRCQPSAANESSTWAENREMRTRLGISWEREGRVGRSTAAAADHSAITVRARVCADVSGCTRCVSQKGPMLC